MPGTPFFLFDWRKPFLPALKDFIARRTDGCPGRALLVVPHNRPWRYLQHLYALDGRPTLLPKVITFTELLGRWREQAGEPPVHTANSLDQVALLRECVAGLSRTDSGLAERFSRMEMEEFLPWGMRLAGVLEELFGYGVTAADIAHMEGEVAPPAAALLAALGRIQEAYARLLRERGWTTPGFDACETARLGEDVPESLRARDGRPVLLAGFALLTPTEDILLRRLWEAGADICLHTDAALALGDRPHWACEEHARWLRRWQARATLADAGDAADAAQPAGPEFHFFAGYDVHSQLEALREDLLAEMPSAKDAEDAVRLDREDGDEAVIHWTAGQEPAGPSTAVVLTHNGLLLPVLHHLPRKDVNISMGYPLERSPLFRLLESLFRTQEERGADGRYYWRSLLECLRHPYLAMLQQEEAVDPAAAPEAGRASLREPLALLAETIRQGSRSRTLEEALAPVEVRLAPREARALRELVHILFSAFAAVRTCAELADALEALCVCLQERGGHIWPHYPLDAEALYRLREHCLPVLRHNALSREPFTARQLFQFARQILRQERIPFEAVPLTGLQVLGMLETRLLHFDRLYILDATDESLPGSAVQDPLLPDSLRLELGLPDARRRERAAAHTLFRLCAGASKVTFSWQEGISRSALFDARKSRSRFVEQLIWQEERRRGRLLVPGEAPLHTPASAARPSAAQPEEIVHSPALREVMRRFLDGRISPTALDAYLGCPKRFVWHYLCRLREAEEVNEGDDHALVGKVVHRVLEQLYRPHIGKTVCAQDFRQADLAALLVQALADLGGEDALPPESRIMLELSVPYRLRKYLDEQPETTIIGLEEPLETRLSLWEGRGFAFWGQADRIDRREGALHLVDYKTGRVRGADTLLWNEEDFWRELDDFRRAAEAGEADADDALPLLAVVRERLHSLQLPCYVALLAGLRPEERVENACLVELYEKGKEHPLFSGPWTDEDYAVALRRCRELLGLVIWHMEHCATFRPVTGRCAHCPYRGACRA
ncbi:PD-(D/E)XK nuclease family protein [uncultured Desulfovibrio sp.]|uniref:PD-(D/E)XK nuclease family protein n=1 Tax=uncultured Desulfovibrio sp. TaxID=167968 RepID=UPI0032099AEE